MTIPTRTGGIQMTKHHLQILFLTLSSAFFGCSMEPPAAQTHNTAHTPNLDTYNNEGLSLSYPSYWTFSGDSTFALYADRSVDFTISDFSTASIMIGAKPESLADRLERELKLNEDGHVINYSRAQDTTNGAPRIRLSWIDTMIELSYFEITIISINSSTSTVVALFQLNDEDIRKEAESILRVANSIEY